MKKTVQIKKLKALELHKLRLTWSNGISAVVELKEAIKSIPAFAPLKAPALFASARIGDWGHSIHWTDEIEMGADTLWRRTLLALGRSDAVRFMEWRMQHGLSLSDAAQELGLSRRMVAYYESGKHPVPKTVLLACSG